jgi:GAF domain-containing protein
MQGPDMNANPKNAPRMEQLQEAVATSRQVAGLPGGGDRSAVSTHGDIDQTVLAFTVFSSLMTSDGIRVALYSVLRKSEYRFISIFRLKDGKATSAVHVDRADLGVLQAGEVDDTATYCCYVLDAKGAFVTADATLDPRTASHVARDAVRSYVGVPIFEPEGELIGTLCHYDLVPRDPAQLDLELLLQVSSAIDRSGQVPPYPGR